MVKERKISDDKKRKSKEKSKKRKISSQNTLAENKSKFFYIFEKIKNSIRNKFPRLYDYLAKRTEAYLTIFGAIVALSIIIFGSIYLFGLDKVILNNNNIENTKSNFDGLVLYESEKYKIYYPKKFTATPVETEIYFINEQPNSYGGNNNILVSEGKSFDFLNLKIDNEDICKNNVETLTNWYKTFFLEKLNNDKVKLEIKSSKLNNVQYKADQQTKSCLIDLAYTIYRDVKEFTIQDVTITPIQGDAEFNILLKIVNKNETVGVVQAGYDPTDATQKEILLIKESINRFDIK
ncbi:MAG: hypothetical protein N3A71_04155 [Candidatus Dojkabacteria bacterium]|nr:hypothetical protein [Candidatus Dojkabacteria bacterium]